MNITVLDHLWANALVVSEPVLLSPLPMLLSEVMSSPVIALRTTLESDSVKAIAAYADEELLPGATLADLLCEECDIHVPTDAVIYIETASVATAHTLQSAEMTILIGQLVLKLATRTATKALIDASTAQESVPHLHKQSKIFPKTGFVVQ